MEFSRWVEELRRRRVIRALVGWGVVSFAVLQVIEPLVHALDLPEWTLKAVVAALALGFPVTAGLAWVFDLKASGIERTAPADPGPGASGPAGSGRVRLALLLLGLGAVAAAPGLVYFSLQHRADRAGPAAGARIPVAVADFENDTGEPELDALSGLLITSLEQSRRLEVLTRSRMVDILHQMGHAAVPRIDESLGREVGKKAEVRALVLAAIHRFDQLYTIELKALDPATSSYLFTLKEDGKGKASVPGMIDRLSERTRQRLRERPAEVEASRLKVAEAITPSLEAYQHYFKGKEVSDSRGEYGEAIREYRQAVAIDPSFGLAQMEIAYLGVWTDLDPAERRAALDAAVRGVERMPKKERALVLAWKAHMDGREEEADAIYVQAAADYPADKEIQYNAGDLRFHEFISARGSSRDLDDILPFFERAVALDPRATEAQSHLVSGLGMLGRRPEMLQRAQVWVKVAPSAVAFDSLGRALTVARRFDEAHEAFRRAAELGISPMYRGNYGHSLLLAGKTAEAERVLRAPSTDWPSARLGVQAGLVEVLLTEGRYREAMEEIDRMPEEVALADRSGAPARLRAAILASTGEAGRAWEAARRLVESRGGVGLVPVHLAYAGDLAHAEEAAALLAPGARQRALHRAVVAWRSGRPDEAADLLGAIERGKYVADRVLAAALLGELEAGRGQDARAIDALERFHSSDNLASLGPANVEVALWTPRSLLLLARAYERTGSVVLARERVGELLARWKRADPGLALLKDAKALEARLRARPPAVH